MWQNSKDVRTLEAIWRVQLDVFWAREPGIVKGNLGRMRLDYLDATGRYSMEDHLLPYFPTHTLEEPSGHDRDNHCNDCFTACGHLRLKHSVGYCLEDLHLVDELGS